MGDSSRRLRSREKGYGQAHAEGQRRRCNDEKRTTGTQARLGGGDALTNPRLRLAVDKAADANMPKDNVQRAITRGSGGADGANYEEVRYEGYGVGGAAVIVECMTDNRVRTVAP